jgi:hypothetical protein
MATIEHLNTSITQMSRAESFALIKGIRDSRRRARPVKEPKALPAKVARSPKKSAPRQQDLFAMAQGMTPEAKAQLLASLMKGLV